MHRDDTSDVNAIAVDWEQTPKKGQLSFSDSDYNPDVLDCLSNLSNDEVFTSPRLANQLLDLLPQELWTNKHAKFLDPVCKSGVFLREIVKRLNAGLAKEIPKEQDRINHILQHQVYGIAITELTALLSRRSVYCAKVANSPLSICTGFSNEMGNIIFGQVAHDFKDGKCVECGASADVFGARHGLENHAYAFIHSNKSADFKELETMKFDVIIGNPPYQLDDGGAGASAKPIYQEFVNQAKKLKPNYLIMITPSRWFAGGKGLDSFRDEMLKDRQFKELHDFPNSKECFANVEIKGGVSYFLWQQGYDGDCEVFTYDNGDCISQMKRPLKEQGIDVFIRYNQAIAILNKVNKFNEKKFDELVSTQKPFGLRTYVKGKKSPFENSVKLYCNGGIGYVDIKEIEKGREWILKHKVLITMAYGAGEGFPHQIINTPFLAEINTACTETYLVINPSNDKQECENVLSYMQTKFFRFMVMLVKNTQHASKKVYQLVPIQDFSQSWDDTKLYQKYGLTKQEINFIESMIRPMDTATTKPKAKGKKAVQESLLESDDERD